jgi:hypothetical protein
VKTGRENGFPATADLCTPGFADALTFPSDPIFISFRMLFN